MSNILQKIQLFERALYWPGYLDVAEKMAIIMESQEISAHVMHGGIMCSAFADYDLVAMSHKPFKYCDTTTGQGSSVYQLLQKSPPLPGLLAIQFELVGPGIGSNDLRLDETAGRMVSSFDMLSMRQSDVRDTEGLSDAMGIPMARKAFNIEAGCYLSFDDLVDMTAAQTHPSGVPIEGLLFRTNDCQHGFRIMNPVYQLRHRT